MKLDARWPPAAIALTTLLAAATAVAQAPAAERTLLVRGARVIDGRGGAPLMDGGVLIRGERIERVGPAAGMTTR